MNPGITQLNTILFPPPDTYRISDDHIEILDQEITKDELHAALKKMRLDTSPGIDGLSVSFMVNFWELVGDLVFESIRYAFQSERFSVSQCRGVIKLIPKKSKNPHFLKNLRPITLLNIDYKMLTKALAVHLQDIMQDTIDNDQNAFIKHRLIGNNVMDLYSVISAAEENNEEAILILLDIEKAFDTINWTFIIQVLESLSFPESFLKWIKIMQVDKELRLFNNGHSSNPFWPAKGVAQGCTFHR